MKCIACIVVLLTSSVAFAYRADTGTVVELRVETGGSAIVKIDHAVSAGRPGCANSGNDQYFGFTLTTDGGKAIFSALTAAYLAGRTVYFRGAGSCSSYADIEELSYARLQ